MPVLFDDSIDSQEVWDGSANFTGGQVSKSRSNTLEQNQAALLQNFDIDVYGRLMTRRGAKQIGDDLNESIQGITFYNPSTPGSEELIVAAGGILRAFNGTVWSLAGGIFNLLSNHTPVIFVQGVDILYIAQSDTGLQYYQSGVLHTYPSTAVAEVSTVSTIGADASNLQNKHFFIEDEDGQACVWFNYNMTGTDPLLGDRSIPVYIVTGDTPTTIATAIAAALESDAKFTATASSTTATITCVTAGAREDILVGNSGLTVAVTTQGKNESQTPPVGMSSLVWHTNRLIGAGVSGHPDTVYFSEFLDGSVWDRTLWSIRVGAGDGDAITGLVPWTNYNLIVLKQHSIWVVNCNPTLSPSEFVINRIHHGIGSVAPNTWVQVGTDLFGLTTSGVRTIKNIIASEEQKEIGPALSEPIGDYIDRINPSAVATSCAFHWGRRYILFAPLDDAATPDTAFPFSTTNNSWMGLWTGWTPTKVAERVDGGVHKMWMGQSDGTVIEFMDYIRESEATENAFKDQGNAIASTLVTKGFIWNELVSPKTGLNIKLEFNRSEAEVTGTVILDEGNEQPWETFDTNAADGLDLPSDLPANLETNGVIQKSFDTQRYDQFQQMQVKLATQSGKLSLSNIAASAFLETYTLQS